MRTLGHLPPEKQKRISKKDSQPKLLMVFYHAFLELHLLRLNLH